MKVNKKKLLKHKIHKCERCELKTYDSFPGHGTIPADILFLTDAPTKTELLIKQAITGEDLRLIKAMIKDAKEQVNFDKPLKIYYLNTVLCRPFISKKNSKFYGQDRIPNFHEILSCQKNIVYIIREVNPKIIVFTGKLAAQYYKYEYPEAIKISHPSYHLVYAGKGSPTYNYDVLALSEAIEEYLK